MKPELMGSFIHNRIHGGVISAALNAMAGLTCMAAIGARHMDEAPLQRLHRFSKPKHHRPAHHRWGLTLHQATPTTKANPV